MSNRSLHRPPRQSHAGPAYRRQPALLSTRSLRLESLERRELLSATSLLPRVPLSAAAPTVTVAATTTTLTPLVIKAAAPLDANFHVLAQAQPNEWYTGLGGAYTPYVPGAAVPSSTATPLVEQDYVWGLTQAPNSAGDTVVWYGTSGDNIALAQDAGGGGLTTGRVSSTSVVEGGQSQFPLVPVALRPYLGDWRPPQIHMYDLKTGVDTNVTPEDPLILETLGLRSAGSANGVVLLAGPSLYGLGINVFAFNASTGAYLGSKALLQYADIRSWAAYTPAPVNGVAQPTQLYAGVANNTTAGTGSVLRWTGSVSSPFSFAVVGNLNAEGANIAVYDNHLFVDTWPAADGTALQALGVTTNTVASLYMSPALSATPLPTVTSTDTSWKVVWTVAQYDPDPALAKSYGGGALTAYNGSLYWGTLQPQGAGTDALKTAYPDYAGASSTYGGAPDNSTRAGAVFSGQLSNSGAFTSQLVVGNTSLPVFSTTTEGATFTWTSTANSYASQSPAPLAAAGFGDAQNVYIWSMAVQDGKLYIGTYNEATGPLGPTYVTDKANLAAVNTYAQTKYGSTASHMGADLYSIYATTPGQQGTLATVSQDGAGNPLNHGVRNLIATGANGTTDYGLILGMANSANLEVSYTNSSLQPSGFQLVEMSTGSSVAVKATAAAYSTPVQLAVTAFDTWAAAHLPSLTLPLSNSQLLDLALALYQRT